MASPLLREKLERREFIVIPGLQDMIAATMAAKVGFDIVYGSGFWLTASSLGLPDAGIATYTQMLDRMATLVRSSGGRHHVAASHRLGLHNGFQARACGGPAGRGEGIGRE